jgi:nucleoprotein TPR
MQLDQTTDDNAAAEARVQVLQKMERALQSKLDELSRDILQNRQELTVVKEHAAVEVQEERRIVTLQKDHLERWQHRYNDVVRETEGLKKAAAQAMQTSEQEMANERKELEQKYTALLEEQAADYESKLQVQQRQIQEDPRRAATLPLMAAAAASTYVGDTDEGPLGLTDLYTRLEETKEALRKETLRRQLAEARFESVRKDIEEKAPIMNRQRQEYDLVMDRLQEYHQRIEQALTERDDAREDSREARQEAVVLQQRLAEKHSEAQELAKQVQALLVSRSGGQVAADVPASIAEMQSQNQRLLSEHRRLTKTVSELEGKLQADTLKTKLEQSESELASLREDRKHQEVQVVQIVQQRDMYRALLKLEHGSLDSEGEQVTALELTKQQAERAKKLELKNRDIEGDLAAARSKLVILERENEVAGERVARYEMHQADLRSSNSKMQDELSRARADAAHKGNDSKYYSDKCERLEQSLQSVRNEVQALQNAKNKVDRVNAGLEERLSKADGRAARLEGEKQQAEMKMRLAQTQAQTAKAAEARLAEESRQLHAELARQGTVVSSVQRIEASLSAKSEEEKEKLVREIELLSQQRVTAVSKQSTEIDNLNGRIQDLEVRIRDTESSKEKSQTEALEAKNSLLGAQTEKQNLSSKMASLESQLRSAKQKLGEGDDTEDVEATMGSKIQSLTLELSSAKTEISALEKRAATYQKMAKESEASLVESTKATEEFKAAHVRETDELKATIEAMKKEIISKQEMVVELTKDLAGQRGEREKLEEELQLQITSLNAQIANDRNDVELAKAAAAALKLDVEDVRKEAVSAQNNYERELSVHSQARTSLRVALEEAQKEAGLRLAAEQQLDLVRNELKQNIALWEDEKASLLETSNTLEKSLAGAREQISLLHTQVEKLGDIVEKDQKSRIAAATEGATTGSADGTDSSQKEFSELREIVKFLRSENEMIHSQLDSAKRKADRERAAASVVKRSLDEGRAELKTLRDQQDSEGSGGREAMDEITEKHRVAEEQLNLLRDSNKLLREEAANLRSAVMSSKSEIDGLKTSSASSDEMKKNMDGKLAAFEAEKLSLKKEVDSWKERVASLVSKFHQIDPEEHKKALKECETLKKEITSLNAWKKTTEEENVRIRTIASNLNKRMKELRAINETQSKENLKLTAEKASLASASSELSTKEHDELKEKITKMEKDAASAKTELVGANDRTDRLRERLRTFQKTIQDLRGKERILNAELSAAQEQISASKTSTPASEAKAQPASSGAKAGQDAKKPDVAPVITAMATKQDTTTSVLAATSDESGPSVPEGGFNFGPSGPTQSKPAESTKTLLPIQTKVPAIGTSATLRPEATGFVPATKINPFGVAAPAVEVKMTPPTEAVKPPPLASEAAGGKRKAPPTEPVKPSETTEGKVEAKKAPPTSTSPAKPAPPSPATGGNGGANKEMSMKEKIMEKKRKLAEAQARKRKMEADLAAQKAKAEAEAGAEPDSKRAKTNDEAEQAPATSKESVIVTTTETKAPEESGISEEKEAPAPEPASEPAPTPAPAAPAAPPKETTEPDESTPASADIEAATDAADEVANDEDEVKEVEIADTEEEVEDDMVDDDDVVVLDDDDVVVVEIDDGANEDEEVEGLEIDEPEEPRKPDTPMAAPASSFGRAMGTGQTSTFGAPSAFGQGFQGSAPTGFGSMATSSTPSSGFGNSFLNMKPPGSSTTAPTFSFGGSSTIKLPTPSQTAPTPSPFGAFGERRTSFGSFGGGSASGGMSNLPLFGTPAAQPAAEELPEAADEDEMEDGEGEMEEDQV